MKTPRQPKPRKAIPESSSGPKHHPQRTGEGPAGHVVLVAGRVGVHQRRLGETDESPRGGIENAQSEQQDGEASAEAGQEARQGKEDPTAQDEQASFPDIPEDSQEWFDDGRDNSRDGKQKPDLEVAQGEIGANKRPGGLIHAEDKLVEEFDQEEGEVGHGGKRS